MVGDTVLVVGECLTRTDEYCTSIVQVSPYRAVLVLVLYESLTTVPVLVLYRYLSVLVLLVLSITQYLLRTGIFYCCCIQL